MPERMYKILLVEDDEALGYVLSEYLKINKFNIEWVKSGKEAIKTLETYTFDLVILDVTLPDLDGFRISEQIKTLQPNLPFIFLTARSMKIDVLKGFSLGAVDYIKKPIDEDELVARIRAITTRVIPATNSVKSDGIYEIGDFQFNSWLQTLHHPKREISLTSRESELLAYLVTNRNELCGHKEILMDIWGRNDYFNKKSLNVFISHLRKYLSLDPKVQIENVHNRGFVLKF